MINQEILDIIHIDEQFFPCSNTNVCINKERTLFYAVGVNIPSQNDLNPDTLFKECCYVHKVLADVNSTDLKKNDYSSMYHQRQIVSEQVEFILYKHETDTEYNAADYGVFKDFGDYDQNVDLSTVKVEWKQVLEQLGAGNYKLIKRVNLAGITTDYVSFTHTLRQYTTQAADKTVRIDVVMNGSLIKEGVNMKDCDYMDSIRIPAFFGRREPKYEKDFIVKKDYTKEQISMIQTNEYKFQTNTLPSCVTDKVWDFMMFANEIYINDYNLNNHSYNFINFAVDYAGNEGTNYSVKNRRAKINLTFEDRKNDRIKRNY